MPKEAKKKKEKKFDKEDFLSLARKRFERAWNAQKVNRDRAIEDLKFLDGDQWPQALKDKRTKAMRPCLVINLLPERVDRVIGDQRQNDISAKIRPVDDKADPETAEVFAGMIRNIEQISVSETIYDSAGESAASCGLGFLRVLTQYVDDKSFFKEIILKRIKNPLAVVWDPDSEEPDFSDADFAFITQKISEEKFKDEHGDKALSDFSGLSSEEVLTWQPGDNVRICEYLYKKVVGHKTIYEIEVVLVDPETKEEVIDKEIVEELPEGITALRQRKVDVIEIWWAKISGIDILEGPTKWDGRYLPIIPIWGKELNIDGTTIYRGVVRNAKDSQRMVNYSNSAIIEITSLAPKAPWLATTKMTEGHKSEWDTANEENYSVLYFEPDERVAGGKPERQTPAQIPTGMRDIAQIHQEYIKSTTGIHDPSLGAPGKEKSGIHVKLEQEAGDVSTFPYVDNLARAKCHASRLLIDLIPHVYDTERMVRILGLDGKEEIKAVNRIVYGEDGQMEVDEDGNPTREHDLSLGKYDAVITTGPTYATQRQEAADFLLQLVQTIPDMFQIVGDIFFKKMDIPGSDEIAERLRKLLAKTHPDLVEPEEGGEPPEEEMSQEEEIPEEAQKPPDPTLALKMENLELDGKKKKVDLAKSMAEAGIKSDRRI